MQDETEVQKLMEENVRLTALLDKKEAQLLAVNEQCKVPVDLVIDHSVQVDVAGIECNVGKYGACISEKQGEVNLEYLGWVIFYTNGILYPDRVVGTDSHTNMIASLGVVGWGVGGIESEATMLR